MAEDLFIGETTGADPIDPVHFDSADLTTHGGIDGMTRSPAPARASSSSRWMRTPGGAASC